MAEALNRERIDAKDWVLRFTAYAYQPAAFSFYINGRQQDYSFTCAT
jgi:hypothetical protein